VRRYVSRVVVLAVVATAFAVLGSANALAYGKADGPVAQVELSGNCNNPDFPLCFPEEQGGVGLGGVWAWAELDTDAGSATAADPSPIDFTFAGCSHTIGGGGRGSAGGHGGPGEGIWYREPNLGDAFASNPNAFPFYDPSTYSGSVYVLDFFPGSGADDFVVVVPTQTGHYSQKPAPGVTIQTQVAP
jgi:hypothetical protein